MMIIFWSILTILAFKLCVLLVNKLGISALNPVLVTMLVLIGTLVISDTDYSTYKVATSWITYLLGPIVVMLAIPLYKSRGELQKNMLPIMTGIVTSVVTSVISVIVMSHLLGLDISIMIAMLPKSITTPMAVEVTQMLGGITGLTIVFVVVTGVIGATLATWTLALFRIKNPIAKGIGIGASAHGIGTAKAVEISSEVAAASGLAMGLSGVVTVLTFSIISKFII